MQSWTPGQEGYKIQIPRSIRIPQARLHEILSARRLKLDGDDCVRGLEFYSSSGIASRRRTRSKVLEAIFCEQNYQREESIRDAETIAAICQEISKKCVAQAARRGLSDRQAAIGLVDDRKDVSRSPLAGSGKATTTKSNFKSRLGSATKAARRIFQ